jgi:uncharacterized heparinase superfamily protein
MPGLSTWFHTLRHLRAEQTLGRALRRLGRPQPDRSPAPRLRRATQTNWITPARQNPVMLGPSRFRFLNEVHDLSESTWDDEAVGKLWRYNLHYFDDLNARDATGRAEWHHALLLDWLGQNPPGLGTGWEPYPTSLRIVNWIKWSLCGGQLSPAGIESLAVQARWLNKLLETHIRGNHLFSNAKALVFVGAFFDGPEAEAWLEAGLDILQVELTEQILPDGGHFERSTMYQALALEDVLDLWNISRTYGDCFTGGRAAAPKAWRECLGPMKGWLQTMCHPDGEIAFFNDAAFGVAPTLHELQRYSFDLGVADHSTIKEGVTHLSSSGYVRVQNGEAVALLDVAPLGPDYLPGHGHADTLSFELSLFGDRLLVNSGTSTYEASSERLRQRGTAAHNTVVVGGENSSDVWSSFRVGRRAYPFDLGVDDSTATVRCSHSGYRRLFGGAVHTREWRMGASELTIEDTILPVPTIAEGRLHLHPSVDAEVRDGRCEIQGPAGVRAIVEADGGSLRIEKSTWHPEFGRTESNRCIVVPIQDGNSRLRMFWGEDA